MVDVTDILDYSLATECLGASVGGASSFSSSFGVSAAPTTTNGTGSSFSDFLCSSSLGSGSSSYSFFSTFSCSSSFGVTIGATTGTLVVSSSSSSTWGASPDLFDYYDASTD